MLGLRAVPSQPPGDVHARTQSTLKGASVMQPSPAGDVPEDDVLRRNRNAVEPGAHAVHFALTEFPCK